MCTVCGCGPGGTEAHGHHHHHHHHGPNGALDFSATPPPGLDAARTIAVETDILAKNDAYAAANRARLAGLGALALNLVSSPGSGKTTLLCRTVAELAGHAPVAVIEGDQQTANDAARIQAAGAPAVQVNTGKGCHLDGHMVGHALERLDPPQGAVVFIENVGNLVCPAAFDLGEHAKVAILSVTEGEDKPLKYPDMFAAAALMVISKIDLAPYVGVDLDLIEANARRVNPDIQTLRVSATSGEGMAAWRDWILARRAACAPLAPRAAALAEAAAS